MVDYWHGGRRNISVGAYLQGPAARRQEWSPIERQIEAHYSRAGYDSERDPKRVYFTTDRELARGWAMNPILQHLEGGGALYRVKPMPPSSLEPDPDYLASGFSARRAQVLEIAEDPVHMDDDEARRAVCWKYSLWTDNSPMYDYDGYLLPSPEHRAAGATPQLYRHLGVWFDIPEGHGIALIDGRIRVLPRPA